MTWTFRDKIFTEQDIPDDVVGFVYCITDTINDKLYIGKKIFFNTLKRKPLKGKTRNRISKVKSDWETYYGSNDILKAIVEAESDKSVFKREILYLCKNKIEMSYLETKEHFDRGVLLTDKYYNGWISCKISNRGLNGLKV